MDPKLHTFIERLRHVRMTKEDRTAVRSRLLEQMKSSYAPVSSPWVYFIHSRSLTLVATILLIVGISSGVSFAAQNALPGDILYTVKTDLNENVGRLINSSSPVAQVNYETKVMETRLMEAETLDQKQELNDGRTQEVKAALNAQENRVTNALVKLIGDEGNVRTITNSTSTQATSAPVVLHADASTTVTATTSDIESKDTIKSFHQSKLRQNSRFAPTSSPLIISASTTASTTRDTATSSDQEEGEGENEIQKVDNLFRSHRAILEKIQSFDSHEEDDH